MEQHSSPITDAAFSPDGTALATAALDGYVKFFQASFVSLFIQHYVKLYIFQRCRYFWVKSFEIFLCNWHIFSPTEWALWTSERALPWKGVKTYPWGFAPFDHHKIYKASKCSFTEFNNHTATCLGLWHHGVEVRWWEITLRPDSLTLVCWHCLGLLIMSWYCLVVSPILFLVFKEIGWISLPFIPGLYMSRIIRPLLYILENIAASAATV